MPKFDEYLFVKDEVTGGVDSSFHQLSHVNGVPALDGMVLKGVHEVSIHQDALMAPNTARVRIEMVVELA